MPIPAISGYDLSRGRKSELIAEVAIAWAQSDGNKDINTVELIDRYYDRAKALVEHCLESG